MTNKEAINEAYERYLNYLNELKERFLKDEDEYVDLTPDDVFIWFVEGMS